jgi:hypothetical protein
MPGFGTLAPGYESEADLLNQLPDVGPPLLGPGPEISHGTKAAQNLWDYWTQNAAINRLGDPNVSSMDKAMALAMGFSGGGLATRAPKLGSLARQAPQAIPEVPAPIEPPAPAPTSEAPSPAGDLVARARQGMPAILGRRLPTPEDIANIKQAAVEYGRKGWPTAEKGVFATTPEAYAETTQLVPQVSIKSRLPGPLPGEELPNSQRALPIVRATDEIGSRIAERLDPMVRRGDETLKFYHTGPVIRGLEQHGEMSLPEANQFMRDWAGQGAATSPRTQTPPNLRNSSWLAYNRAIGSPITPEAYAAQGNTPGFPMMGMHVDLADKFARGVENPWVNPKPTTFRENWSGNLQDVTGDTHNIRSTLFQFDQIYPGKIPRGWFVSDDAFKNYKTNGFASVPVGDFVDKLGKTTVNKIPRQSEYLPMTEPWYNAAQKLGIAPAEAQSGGWFSYGGITGLQSPPKTIPNLLNDQVAATAKALNVPPERVVNWWARGLIPLAGMAGAAVLPSQKSQAAPFGSLAPRGIPYDEQRRPVPILGIRG